MTFNVLWSEIGQYLRGPIGVAAQSTASISDAAKPRCVGSLKDLRPSIVTGLVAHQTQMITDAYPISDVIVLSFLNASAAHRAGIQYRSIKSYREPDVEKPQYNPQIVRFIPDASLSDATPLRARIRNFPDR